MVKTDCFPQSYDAFIKEPLAKKGIRDIKIWESCCSHHGNEGKEIYLITTEKNDSYIYNLSLDVLEKDTLTSLSGTQGEAKVGKNKQGWFLFNGDLLQKHNWNPVRIKAEAYDSIKALNGDSYLAFKDGKKWFLKLNKELNGISDPKEIEFEGTDYVNFSGGLIAKVRDKQKLVYKYIQYVNYLTYDEASGKSLPDPNFKFLKPDERFIADSILIWPVFNRAIISLNGKTHLYSFLKDAIIESDFHKFYLAPIYQYPIILTDSFVGYGDENELVKIPIDGPQSIEFDQMGDYLYGLVKTRNGKTYKIDFVEKKIILE
ncbi:MAG: hypothetical protein ACO1O1_09970 [Adhaeribacter sp.]